MKQTPRLWSTASSFASFAIGFLVGFAIGFPGRRYLVFKNEVEVGDLLNLFSALLIALALQNAIQKRVGNTRVEKDLLIARVTAMDGALNELHKLFMRRAADAQSVDDAIMLAAFKDLSNYLYLLEMALAKSARRTKAIELKTLKDTRLAYRECVLGDDFSPGPYSPDTINLEERTYRSIALELISVTFQVNSR